MKPIPHIARWRLHYDDSETNSMEKDCDIIIVGGGVIGTAIAWALGKRRAGKIVVLEKRFLGAGSSGKSGAIVRQHYSNRLTALMAQKSLRVFEKFPDVVGGPPVFTRTGMVLVVNDRDRPALEANLRLQQDLGIKTGLVDRAELREIAPAASLAEDEIAAFESEAGYVEAVQAVASFAEAARRHDCQIVEGAEVKSILCDHGKVQGVETNLGRYRSRILILATGPWAGKLAPQLRTDLPVQPSRTQVALFRRPADFARPGPVFGDFVKGVYFKPTHGDILHAGSLAGEEIRNPVDPDNYDESADGSWLPMIRQRVGDRYPAMQRGYGRGGYGALYAITPDWHPIIDRIPGVEGAYCAVGFSGHGFKMSPMVGELVAELVVDGRPRSLDIQALRLSRFAERDPVKTPYEYGVMG
jgi:glycine/D-amino acid oxidase-like deaminating enzyme